jgi:mono/diheme cytochrome c family protein
MSQNSMHRPIRRMVSALAALTLGTALSAWGGERPPKGGEIRPDVLYHNYCSVCHGDKGDGNSRAKTSLVPPPKDLTQSPHLTRDYIVAVVTNGKPGTAMVSWKTQLTAEEIGALADYLMAAFVNKTIPVAVAPKGISGTAAHGGRSADAPAPPATPVKVDMTLPMPGGLKGDAAQGGKFYRENCATCHGKKGDGKGPRAYFINPKPRNFLDSSSRAMFNRPALYAAVSFGKVGTEMPAWKFVLTEQQMANVAEYVFRSFIQPSASAKPGR